MRAKVDLPPAPPRAVRGDRVRHAALVAGVGLDRLLRAPAEARVPRPVLIGAGLIAGGAAAALFELAGADVRGGFAGGQPGFVPLLLQWVTSEESQLRP
jgi:hypothetical protein